jgi:hypothetical protein
VDVISYTTRWDTIRVCDAGGKRKQVKSVDRFSLSFGGHDQSQHEGSAISTTSNCAFNFIDGREVIHELE